MSVSLHPRRFGFSRTLAMAAAWCLISTAAGARAAELWVGTATADITPDRPIPLTGMTSVRIAREIISPVTVSVLALESREGGRAIDQAILVSCDLCVIRPGIQAGFRKHLAGRLAGFNLNKLFLAATHTHTAPEILQDRYDEKDYLDAMQPKEYVPWMYQRMAEAVIKAWEGRSPGAVAWGLGHAVVGRNRRVVYADGTARMYGDTNKPDFRQVEGYEDHAVHVLCFYDLQKRLQAAAISLACPAQSLGGTKLSADFWHDARQQIGKRHGEQLCVLGFCSPAGDQAPNILYRKAAESRMDKLRGLTYTQELGRRIAVAFDEVAPLAAKEIRADVPLVHLVQQIQIPARIITEDAYAAAKKVCDEIAAKKVRGKTDAWTQHFYGLVVQRYLAQQKGGWKTFDVELHVLRLGDVAIATSPFELYVDYGIRIQARSPATETFLIQLAATGDKHAYYLPTARAVAAGAMNANPFTNYSATAPANMVGPEGGQALVEQTLKAIGELFKK